MSLTSGSTAAGYNNSQSTSKKTLALDGAKTIVKTANSIKEEENWKETTTTMQLQQQQQALQTSVSSSQLNKTKQVEQATQIKSSSSFKNIGRHFFIGSRAQSDADLNQKNGPKTITQASGADLPKSVSLDPNLNNDEPLVEPADGPSQATFNIILVGDSFVGKSSFASRFIEGSFVQGLISNCSIDFKAKQYKVDGTNYTVNLWDTA